MTTLTWVETHGAITHFPIAFLIAGSAFEIGAALFRKPEWRVVSFWMLVVAALSAIPSLVTGWFTGEEIYAGPAQAPPIYYAHRNVAYVLTAFTFLLLAWRVKLRDQFSRRPLIASGFLALGIAAMVSYTGFLGGQMVFGEAAPGSVEASSGGAPSMKKDDSILAKGPSAYVEGKTLQLDPALVSQGEKLFNNYQCLNCHLMNGKGTKTGPDLTHAGRLHPDINWQIQHMKNPQKLVPGSTMPAYEQMKEEELRALAAFLVTRD